MNGSSGGIDSSKERLLPFGFKKIFLRLDAGAIKMFSWLFMVAADFIRYLSSLAAQIFASALCPSTIRFSDFLYYVDKVGIQGLPIVVTMNFLQGIIVCQLAMKQVGLFGLQSFVPSFLTPALIEEVAPMLVAIIVLGRSGTAFAVEIGTMKFNDELDAIKVMGINRFSFVEIPKLLAMQTVMPFLGIVSVIAALVGAMISSYLADISCIEFCQQAFDAVKSPSIFKFFTKVSVFAFMITVISCHCGNRSEKTPEGVGEAATHAIVMGLLVIIATDMFVNQLFRFSQN